MRIRKDFPIESQNREAVPACGGDDKLVTGILIAPLGQPGGVDGNLRRKFDNLHAMRRQRDAEPVRERHAEDEIALCLLTGDFQQTDGGHLDQTLGIDELADAGFQQLWSGQGRRSRHKC